MRVLLGKDELRQRRWLQLVLVEWEVLHKHRLGVNCVEQYHWMDVSRWLVLKEPEREGGGRVCWCAREQTATGKNYVLQN